MPPNRPYIKSFTKQADALNAGIEFHSALFHGTLTRILASLLVSLMTIFAAQFLSEDQIDHDNTPT